MTFEGLKKLATDFLLNYKEAWRRNTALETLLKNYPMPDGTKGIPRWKEITDYWLSDTAARSVADERFAPFFHQITSAQQESDLLDLLRKVPPVGGIQ